MSKYKDLLHNDSLSDVDKLADIIYQSLTDESGYEMVKHSIESAISSFSNGYQQEGAKGLVKFYASGGIGYCLYKDITVAKRTSGFKKMDEKNYIDTVYDFLTKRSGDINTKSLKGRFLLNALHWHLSINDLEPFKEFDLKMVHEKLCDLLYKQFYFAKEEHKNSIINIKIQQGPQIEEEDRVMKGKIFSL